MSEWGLKEGASDDGVSLTMWTPAVWVWLGVQHTGGGWGGLASGCLAARERPEMIEDEEKLCLWSRKCTKPEERASSQNHLKWVLRS